jgi:hypothetical protein
MMTQRNTPIKWAFIDSTNGAPCANGEVMTPEALATIAAACTLQLNRDYGSNSSARAATADTIQPGERVFTWLNGLSVQGALAFHSVDGQGVEYGEEDITGCSSLFGMGASASAAASHEMLETENDPGCNRGLDDGQGTTHADEECDAIEVQTYAVQVNGIDVGVSNFLLDSWGIPGAPPPYTFMTANNIPGGVDPPGPMQTAPGNGGNYQSVWPSPTSFGQVTAEHVAAFTRGGHALRIVGTPRKPAKVKHWNSRAAKRGVV